MLSKDRIGAFLLLTFCLGYWYFTYQIRMLPFQKQAAFSAQTMPEALSVIGVVLALLLLVSPGRGERLDLKGFRWKQGMAMLGLMVSYGLTLRTFGFIASTSIFLMAGYAVLGERRPLYLLVASLPIVVAFWALMTQGLDIYVEPLPGFLRETG